ncbi:MAG: hypothetical protein KBH99_05785 [Syntrophobacteraceae bacterium]|nr:hypothetical protein [Syntrophobacteraceae bacterium]
MAHFDRAIPPGAEGKVTLKVNLKGYQGNVKKTATVFSNDPQNPRSVLTVQGFVRSLIELRPGSAVAFRGVADQLPEKVVELLSTSETFGIRAIETDLQEKIEYSLETVEEGKHYRLKVRNRLKQGTYSGFLKVLTDHPQKSEVLIRVNGSVESEIGVRPSSVLIGRLVPHQPPRSAKVMVVSNKDRPFQITKLSYDENLIRVNQQPLSKDSGFILEIVPLIENIASGSRLQLVLGIQTDAEPQEEHQVYIQLLNIADPPAATPSPPADGVDKGGKPVQKKADSSSQPSKHLKPSNP